MLSEDPALSCDGSFVVIILVLFITFLLCGCFQLLLPKRVAGLGVHVWEYDVEDIAVPVYGVTFDT